MFQAGLLNESVMHLLGEWLFIYQLASFYHKLDNEEFGKEMGEFWNSSALYQAVCHHNAIKTSIFITLN